MQSVQDLTVERPHQPDSIPVRAGRSDKALLDLWVPRLVDRMKQLPRTAGRGERSENKGLGRLVSIDSRHGGRLAYPQNIDDALYDSFGQRQVSTIYTQTNQFHVILEVAAPVSAGFGGPGGDVYSHRIGLGQSGDDHRTGGDEQRPDGSGGAGAGSAPIV